MLMRNNRLNKSVYLYILFGIYLLIVVLIPFIKIFDLNSSDVYRTIIFGLGAFDLIMLLIITIGEFVSLRFDRTASSNTFISALFIFISFLTNKETIASINFIFPNSFINSEITIKYVSPIVSLISLSVAFYFMFRFYERDYNVKEESNKFIFGLALIDILSILFISLSINIGLLVTTIIKGVGLILCTTYYLWETREKSNFITSLLAYCICLALVSISILSITAAHGLATLLYVSVVACFIFIYLHFFIDKTNKIYELEDIEISKDNRKIITVKCFNSFDCFIDGNIIKFPSKKCKEYFALLVTLKGKALNMDKAITYLYPDKDIDKSKISYRDIIWKLRKLFKDLNFLGITFNRSETILNLDFIKCDYYDVLDKKTKYNEEPFMPEYDWSMDFENALKD